MASATSSRRVLAAGQLLDGDVRAVVEVEPGEVGVDVAVAGAEPRPQVSRVSRTVSSPANPPS